MKKIIIQENQKGLLFKNGKYLKMLGTGKYWTLGGKSIEVVDLDASLTPKGCKVETLLADPAVAAETVVCAVTDGQLALHFRWLPFQELAGAKIVPAFIKERIHHLPDHLELITNYN